MNKKNMEEFDDEAMPTICEECHEWFDLNDGFSHPDRSKNITICEQCYDKLARIKGIEEELENLSSAISDAEYTIKNSNSQINILNQELDQLRHS